MHTSAFPAELSCPAVYGFAPNLHGMVCGGSIADIIKVEGGAAILRLLTKQHGLKGTVVLVRKGF